MLNWYCGTRDLLEVDRALNDVNSSQLHRHNAAVELQDIRHQRNLNRRIDRMLRHSANSQFMNRLLAA